MPIVDDGFFGNFIAYTNATIFELLKMKKWLGDGVGGGVCTGEKRATVFTKYFCMEKRELTCLLITSVWEERATMFI